MFGVEGDMSMRKWNKPVAVIWLIGSLCLWWNVSSAQDNIPVLSLYLEMKARDADVLFKKEPYDRSTFPVSVSHEGEHLKGRIEVKGSFSRNFDKKSLKIKLEKGQQWRGQRQIALNAMATDASMMREWLAWNLVHTLGMAAPNVNFTRLYINRRYIGMFLHIEWIDPNMLARFGLGNDGEFFHPRDSGFCGDLSPQSVSDPDRCWLKLSPRDKDFSALRRLSEQLHEVAAEDFDTFLEAHFDVDSVINWLVSNVITSNGDTYNKNYFIYFSREKERWVIIPWDFDLSLGRNWDEFLKYPANILNDNFQYFYPLELGLPNPLKDKLLKNPVLLARLKQKLRGVMGMPVEGYSATPVWFSPEVMHKRIDALTAFLADDLHRERYTVTNEQKLREHARALKDYATFRYNYLRKTVLETTDWVADRATIEVNKAGDTRSWVDGFGMTLATMQALSLNGEAEISTEVEKMTVPKFVPKGVDADRCVKRTWFLVDKTPYSNLKINLSLQYMQENSRKSEIGKKLKDEHKLDLWVLYYDQWTRLKSSVNPVSNVIETSNLDIKAGRLYRFVACQR
jgi:hypothetical protein